MALKCRYWRFILILSDFHSSFDLFYYCNPQMRPALFDIGSYSITQKYSGKF